MITHHSLQAIRRHGPNRGTACALGSQVTSEATGFQTPADLFKGLGYSDFFDIDYNGRASVQFDLNYASEDLRSKADLLFDGGVLEHVANIGQGLTTVHNLVRQGGVIVMVNPLNCYGESYYGLDPQLYHDFFTLNGWTVLQHELHVYRSLRASLTLAASRMLPDALKAGIIGRLKKGTVIKGWLLRDVPSETRIIPVRYGVHRKLHYVTHQLFVARKEEPSRASVKWPSQGMYPKV